MKHKISFWSTIPYSSLAHCFRNKTDIEDYIVSKAKKGNPSFIFPYHLGWKENVKEIVSASLRKDGITWRVANGLYRGLGFMFSYYYAISNCHRLLYNTISCRSGCDEFSFTAEQVRQKKEKATQKQAFYIGLNSGYFGMLMFITPSPTQHDRRTWCWS